MLQAPPRELVELFLHNRCLGEQRLHVIRVAEIANHLDPGELDGAVPERVVFFGTIKAEDLSRTAQGSVMSRRERRQLRARTYVVSDPTPRGSQLTMS